MPNPERGCYDLESIFEGHILSKVKNKKMRWRYIAALTGAHTLGQASLETSGYDGHWSDAAN